jgi:antirestriction protein
MKQVSGTVSSHGRSNHYVREEPNMSYSPKIYVACLAAYNNGKLHGKWIDAAQDADDIQSEVDDMLKTSPEPGAEEWAEEYLEDTGAFTDVPETLRRYFDFEAYARDCELGGDVMFLEESYNSIHVFNNN